MPATLMLTRVGDDGTCRRRKATAPGPTSEERDAIRFQALLAVDDIDADALPRIEAAQSAAPQGRHMDEDVLAAAIGRNEAIALVGLEPFDGAFERGGRPRGAPLARIDGGRIVDVEDVGDERPFGAVADLAGDRR